MKIQVASINRIDLVISRFNEDLSWLKELPLEQFSRIIVYNKGPRIPFSDYINNLYIINLPNVGREAHTYLYHIIENYDNLTDLTIFLPGSANMENKWTRTEKVVSTTIETMQSVFPIMYSKNLKKEHFDFSISTYQSTNNNNRSINSESYMKISKDRPFGKWFETCFGDLEVSGIMFNGIFSVSKKHIHNRSRDFYNFLISYVNDHSNPEAGHFFERAWHAVFSPIASQHFYLGY
jgi:hypothetical protein